MCSIEIMKIFAYVYIFQVNVLYGVGVRIYSNEFAVHISQGDKAANTIAARHGFINRGQVGSLKGFYLFEHNHVHKRSLKANDIHQQKLTDEPEVLWVQQQHEKKRTKRDSSFFSDYQQPIDLGLPNVPHRRLHHRSVPSVNFPDPLFKEQWYLNGGAKNGLDMNVGPAWQKGYTGKGVVVSILDDGIQTNHPDLAQNYDPAASTDINGNDDDPMPQDNGDNKHGTRCAGEVSGVAYNQFCGVGIAYNSSIGGVRMLDGVVNDAVEARALGLNPDHIDIYSASWGPEDDGKTVDGPGPLARRAFIYGVTSGRKGKGSIFVWASGNGGRHTDSCNCDGYTNSIFTLSISSATQGGYKPWYLEECSSTLATTYSSGTPGHDKSVATVDMDARLRSDHICTVEHTGTSASAPLAAGICALALEANPSLTWRDMQYLVVLTSRASPLEKETGWVTNGVKRKVSHKFGYGLMDAAALVDLAESWTTVPPQHICKSREIVEDREIGSKYGDSLNLHMDVDACINTLNEIRFLEHVQCKVSLRFFPRGNLRIILTSPMGTQSTLLFERPRDVVSSNFDDWPFLSVHFWGEQALGRWTIQVVNAGTRHVNQPGILKKWQLVFYGTNIQPVRLRQAVTSNNRNLWKIPFGSLFSQAPPEPIVKVTDNLFSSDVLRNFHNFPNVYTFSGSEKQEAITYLGERKSNVRKNIETDMNYEKVSKDCDEQCLHDCLGAEPTKCIACKNNRKKRDCSSACPARSFADNNGVCQPCHEACDECSGPNQMNCISCSSNYFRVLDINICLQQCPEGYFADYIQRTCIACHPNCLACQNELDHCSSCDHHLLLYENKCVAACPIGTYETESYSCAACHNSCSTCNGPSSSQCISCTNGYFWNKGTCNQKCPAHHFADPNHRECIKCAAGCLECNETTCLSCSEDLQNVEGRCVLQRSSRCDKEQYLEGGLCKLCHSTCDSCRGPSEQDCLSCVKPFMLQDTRCVPTCFKGTFHDEIERACKPCLHTCTDCFSRINCTECSYGLQLQDSACVSSCIMGFYNDKGQCKRCSTNCETCRGPQEDQCVTCPIGWQLKNGQCKLSCKKGQYKTQYGCQECESSCDDCIGCSKVGKQIDVEQLLLSSHSASTFQIMNSLSFFSTIAIVASFCIIMVLITVFFFLQKSPILSSQSHVEFRILSMDKPNITCNYKIVGDEDFSDNDISEGVSLIESKPDRTC